ncbi:Lactonase, 7-bladed beta-propeller-domain-containing protein [Coniochaeta sp. 2T2.1]|nr:Lactonase, 7-bladed beta-propeller-domain-containing protein [Coniochaeta sp. 2T2.1]
MLVTRSLVGFILAVFLPQANSAKHHLFVSNLTPPSSLYALEFDDESLSLKVTANITADAPHSWITFNISSYSVTSNHALTLSKSIPASGKCFNRTSAFAAASDAEPYRVVTGQWPGPDACGMSFDVFPNGTLDRVADSWGYANKSGVHGLALGKVKRKGQLLYSADLNGDAIWTHRIAEDGRAEVVGRFAVKNGSHPRHLAAHPGGERLYAVMEAGNRVASFTLRESGAVEEEEDSYSLIPNGKNTSNYWSAEVMLSPDARFLWATARAQINTTIPGYISAFLVDEEGVIVKRMFRKETTTVGGIANMVSPAPWSNEWVALTDIGTGYVQVWKMGQKKEGRHGTEYGNAEALARVDIKDGGCCAVAIWFD